MSLRYYTHMVRMPDHFIPIYAHDTNTKSLVHKYATNYHKSQTNTDQESRALDKWRANFDLLIVLF